MINNLVGGSTVVLENVVILRAAGDGESLCDGQEFREVLVGDIGKFGTVVLGNYELDDFNGLLACGRLLFGLFMMVLS